MRNNEPSISATLLTCCVAIGSMVGILLATICFVGFCLMALDRHREELEKRQERTQPSLRSR